jgi:MHS family proline/betaine transporter-like MFS transporter
VFAVGYAARPVGGVIFGHIGDRFGRKPSLIISVFAMGVATFLLGILPDHSQIGVTAAFLLVVLRIIQGISVGGEFTGSIVFLAEHAPPLRRGYFAAWSQLGCVSGFLLGSAVGALVSTILGAEAMHAWGWRVPFLLGALIAIFGIVARRHIGESPEMETKTSAAGSPVKEALRDHWRPMLRIILLILPGSVGFYMIFIYAASYLTQQMHVSTSKALDINTINLLLMLLLTLPGAMLSDRIGRKPVFYFYLSGLVLLTWPLWWLMHEDSFALILIGQMSFAALFGIAFAVYPATMVEMLPREVRCSGVSIAYNVCLGLFGGTVPLVATYLVQRTSDDFAPAYYLIAASAISLLVVFRLPETARKPLT